MDLRMDPNIILSIVNMKLRDQYQTLDAFCYDEDVKKEELMQILDRAGFKYNKKNNQFIAK